VERQPRVRIFGVEKELRAQVQVLNAFSAHADKDDLLAYATASGTTDKTRFFLVHGEPDQQEPLARAMASRGLETHVPRRGDGADIT
jgi:metallo-beta-lactamase family protein